MPDQTFASRNLTVESLESRRLLSTTWGTIPQLIGQDQAADHMPGVNGAGQTIAVIDTGIDYTHPALGGGFGAGYKVVGGYDFVDNDADPMDTVGHGTRVAGVIAADPFDHGGRLFSGVAPAARLVALRIDDSSGPVPNSRIESALQWVIDNRSTYNINVVNISFGYGSFKNAFSDSTFGDELKTLRDQGVIITSSSGNDGLSGGQGMEYPAVDPSVVSVGAVDRFDVITEYSERSRLLDMLAPGSEVPTTSLAGSIVSATGTSYAAPFVAGTVALMKQIDPNLQPRDMLSILRAASSDNYDGDDEFGTVTNLTFPRLNVFNSIKLAAARTPGLSGSGSELGLAGNSNDVVFDSNGVLHMVYYDSSVAKMRYATRSTDGNWSSTHIVDDSGYDVGQFLSLALDQRGRPAIAYFHANFGDLYFARFDGSQWNTEMVDWKHSVGLYPTLVYDQQNNPVISYYRKASGDLRLARHDGSDWTITDLDVENDRGRSTSMAMNRAGKLAIAYEDSTTGHLRVAIEGNNGWSTRVVDASTRGVSFISLGFDQSGRIGVSYYDAWPADLKYALLKSDGKWRSETIVEKGPQGLYSQLYFDNGAANILYYNRRANLVMRASGTIGTWELDELHSGGGRYIAHSIGPDHVTYSWYQTGTGVLRFSNA